MNVNVSATQREPINSVSALESARDIQSVTDNVQEVNESAVAQPHNAQEVVVVNEAAPVITQ